MKLSIVIPAYNEEDSIQETIDSLENALTKISIPHEILVVNDNSKDNTTKILESLIIKYPNVKYVTNNGPNGFGYAIRYGLHKIEGDCVAIMMADLSDSPYDLIKYYATTISIKKQDGAEEQIETSKAIIATGSKPTVLPFLPIDKTRIITSTEALSLKELPKSMVIIGGGVIGLELGSVYQRLGTQVSVIEFMDKIIPTMDDDMGKELQRSLKKLGVKFYLSHKVTGAVNNGDSVTVSALDKKEQEVKIDADYCLVAIGRKPYTDNLGLENIGITLNERKQIPVDAHLQTAVPNIYAIGDVIQGAMLAHKAEEEGVFVAEVIAGQKPHINYNLIPGVVYTWPEVAAVGQTENQLKEKGIAYKVGSFPFRALGRARASGDIDGLAKVLADASTDEILGVHIIGARAADIIAEAVVAMEFRASAEDIGRISHAHPTYTEALKEAALAATENRSLHS